MGCNKTGYILNGLCSLIAMLLGFEKTYHFLFLLGSILAYKDHCSFKHYNEKKSYHMKLC